MLNRITRNWLACLFTLGAVHGAAAQGATDWRSEGFTENFGLAPESVRFTLAAPVGEAAVMADGALAYVLRDADGQHRQFVVHSEGFGAWSEPRGQEPLADDVRMARGDALEVVARFREVAMRARAAAVSYHLRRSEGGSPEQVFEIAPGVEAEQLALRFEGLSGLTPVADGSLELKLGDRTLTWSAPKAWQLRPDGSIEAVRVRYRINGLRAGFHFGRFDRQRPLYVDPFLARSYHGGDGSEHIEQVKQAQDGTWVVEGMSTSNAFPGQPAPPMGPTYRFLTRFSNDLTQRHATLLFPSTEGGSSDDPIHFVQHEASGKWFVASALSFGGAMRVRRLDSALASQEALISLPPRAGGGVSLRGLAIDVANEKLYVAGIANCIHLSDPGCEFRDIAHGLLVDAETIPWYIRPGFVLALPTSLAQFERVTLSPQMEYGGIVVAPGVVALLVNEYGGQSLLSDMVPDDGIPTTVIERFHLDLNGRHAPAWLSGSGIVAGQAIAYDNVANEIVIGGRSNAADLPQGSESGARATPFGATDVFVARFSSIGVLKALTYVGSHGDDYLMGMAVGADGIHVLVSTNLGNYPPPTAFLPGLANALQPVRTHPSRTDDRFVSLLSRSLGSIVRSTWLPEPTDAALRSFRGHMAARAASSTIALGGFVSHAGECGELTDSTFSLPGAAQGQAAGGCSDAFIETLTKDLAAPVVLPGDTCANTITSNCGAPIPNNSPFNNWLDSNRAVAGCGYVRGLRVGLDISHSWIGDLTVTLHAPDGTARTLLDRPGAPGLSINGCSSDNLRVIFDDAASNQAELTCADAPPASHAMLGTLKPAQTLAGFHGKPADGGWLIRVVDSASGDAGVLQDWSLELDCSATPPSNTDLEATFVSLTAPGIGNAIVPGMPFNWTARVRNLGPAAVTGARLESDLRGHFSQVSFTCTPVSGATCVTPSGSGGLVQADLDLGVNGIAEVTITATPNASFDSPLVGGYADVYRPAALGSIGLDPNPSNDRAQWLSPIQRVADLQVSPLGLPAAAAPNATTSFQFAVINNGPSRVLHGLVRLLPLEKLAVESFACMPGTNAASSPATFNGSNIDIDALLSPDSEGFLVCDVVVRISGTAQPGDTARVAFLATGSEHTDGTPGNDSHEHAISVIVPSVDLFKDGFE